MPKWLFTAVFWKAESQLCLTHVLTLWKVLSLTGVLTTDRRLPRALALIGALAAATHSIPGQSCTLVQHSLSFSDRQWLNEFTLQLGRFTIALLPCEPSLIISRAVCVTRCGHVWVLAVRRQAELLSCNSLSVPTGAYPAPGSKKCECNSQICRSTVLRNILRQECTWQNYQWS